MGNDRKSPGLKSSSYLSTIPASQGVLSLYTKSSHIHLSIAFTPKNKWENPNADGIKSHKKQKEHYGNTKMTRHWHVFQMPFGETCCLQGGGGTLITGPFPTWCGSLATVASVTPHRLCEPQKGLFKLVGQCGRTKWQGFRILNVQPTTGYKSN